MIRRNILIADWDHRVVKWSLVASAFALTLGAFAQNRLELHAQQPSATVECAAVAPMAPDAVRAPSAPVAVRLAD
jgi:hypothetical protein